MAQDYRGFQDKMAGDLSQASMAAAGMEKVGKGSKVRIRTSDIEALVPSGSSVEFKPIACHKLKFGDILFVRLNKEFVLRRFVSFQIGRQGAVVAVARVLPPSLESYPDTAIVGRVMRVESKGVAFDPHKKEGLGQRIKNEWTCFGTSTPVHRVLRGFKTFGQMMAPKKKKK